MPALTADSYGGAVVRRRVSRAGGEPLLAGDIMTREDLRAMPVSNLRALVDNHTIEPWPWRPPGELHLIQVGKGQFIVIEGEKLTPEPISKDDADALIASRAS
jgi:hypothetical protein